MTSLLERLENYERKKVSLTEKEKGYAGLIQEEMEANKASNDLLWNQIYGHNTLTEVINEQRSIMLGEQQSTIPNYETLDGLDRILGTKLITQPKPSFDTDLGSSILAGVLLGIATPLGIEYVRNSVLEKQPSEHYLIFAQSIFGAILGLGVGTFTYTSKVEKNNKIIVSLEQELTISKEKTESLTEYLTLAKPFLLAENQ